MTRRPGRLHVDFDAFCAMYTSVIQKMGANRESRAGWRAAIGEAAAMLERFIIGRKRLAGGRWASRTGPPVSEAAYRAYCEAHDMDADWLLMDTMVPECATNLTVTGDDALVFTTRLCNGVDCLDSAIHIPDWIGSGHPLIFVDNVTALGFFTPEEMARFVTHAPVGSSLLSPMQEALFIRWARVPKYSNEDDGEIDETEQLLMAVRAWASAGPSPPAPATSSETGAVGVAGPKAGRQTGPVLVTPPPKPPPQAPFGVTFRSHQHL